MKEQVGKVVAGCLDKNVPEHIRKQMRDHSHEVLHGFMMHIDVVGLSLVDAFRQLFQVLVLPSEAQMLDQILQAFTLHFCESGGGCGEEETEMGTDAAYVLGF